MDFYNPSSRMRQIDLGEFFMSESFHPRTRMPMQEWIIFDNPWLNRNEVFKGKSKGANSACHCCACVEKMHLLDSSKKNHHRRAMKRNNVVERPLEFLVKERNFIDENRNQIIDTQSSLWHSNEDKKETEDGLITNGARQQKPKGSNNENYNQYDKKFVDAIGTEIKNLTEKSDETEGEDQIVTDANSTQELPFKSIEEKNETAEKLKTIERIQIEVNKLAEKINSLTEDAKRKDYLFCEEMLTKHLLQLDNVLANGEDTIRIARKSVVSLINENIQRLELLSS